MKSRRILFGLLPMFAVLIILMAQSATPSKALPAAALSSAALSSTLPSYEGTIAAPDFPTDVDWINVAKPLTMAQLRGKVVLLDFWTYGCINCIHILPDLKRLESEYANELVIVGVHSAKFSTEGNTAHVRQIVQRYEIDHPVLNDNRLQMWTTYGVQAWPTVILIDPLGKILGDYSGEGVYDSLSPVISTMVNQFDTRKAIDRTPIITAPQAAAIAAPLSFPGKVLADTAGGRLFISDTGHNRIVVVDLKTYAALAVIGSGAEGLQDGAYTTASFYHPQGLVLNGNTLYVADTDNHAIRAVDLDKATVSTIAGTGEESLADPTIQPLKTPAIKTALNSPWALTTVGDTLYIAMAGAHQLWAFDLKTNALRPYAGSGQEGLQDAPLLQAQLAQPSGLTTDGKLLYFADPEASAIRVADLNPNGAVRTLVGTGLFDFGDTDAVGDAARLQHALGVTVASDGKLYIADTYNSKIKQIDPVTRTVKTLFGHVEGGLRDGSDPLFNEPGGLSFADGKLYIADTNNSAIRVADLSTMQVSTITFPDADVLAVQNASVFGGETIRLAAQTVAPGDAHLIVNINVPRGFRLNDTAPFALHISAADPVLSAPPPNVSTIQPMMPITLPLTLKAGQIDLTADADVYYCDAVNEKLCYVARVRLIVPLTVSAGSPVTDVALTYTVAPPKVPANTVPTNTVPTGAASGQ